MKTKSLWLILAAVALASTSILANPLFVPKKGTSILHLMVRKVMVNEGVVTNATGRVDLERNQQGKADNQRLDITLGHLGTNVTYQLLALRGDATHYTQITQFSPGTNGAAALRYVKIGASQNSQAGLGRGRIPLPATVNPVSDLRALVVANSSTQAVLAADLTEPDKLTYLVQRWLDSSPAYTNTAAQLRLMATTNFVQFRLRGYGLTPGQNFLLAVNGSVVGTNSANALGMLSFTNLPVSPSDILLVHAVAIWDSVSNNVLSTHLP